MVVERRRLSTVDTMSQSEHRIRRVLIAFSRSETQPTWRRGREGGVGGREEWEGGRVGGREEWEGGREEREGGRSKREEEGEERGKLKKRRRKDMKRESN